MLRKRDSCEVEFKNSLDPTLDSTAAFTLHAYFNNENGVGIQSENLMHLDKRIEIFMDNLAGAYYDRLEKLI